MTDPTSLDDPSQLDPGADPVAPAKSARKRKAQGGGAARPAQPVTKAAGRAPGARASRATTRSVEPVPVMAALPPAVNGEVIHTDRLSIVQGGAQRVDAGTITISQGGIGEATAGTVEVRQGGIGRLEAEDVLVAQGGIALARGDRIAVELGGIGAALANDLRVTQGAVGSAIARTATIEQGLVRTLVAQEVRFERPSGVLVLLAARVSGDVRTLLDWRGALAFGAAFGVVTALLRGRRRGA
jgi:hypothetical protein